MRCGVCKAQRIGTFALCVISCLPEGSRCSSQLPSSQLDVTDETTTERSLPHDFAPSPRELAQKVDSFLVRKSRFWSSRAKIFRLRRPKVLRRQALPRAASAKNFEQAYRATVFQDLHHRCNRFWEPDPYTLLYRTGTGPTAFTLYVESLYYRTLQTPGPRRIPGPGSGNWPGSGPDPGPGCLQCTTATTDAQGARPATHRGPAMSADDTMPSTLKGETKRV